MQKVSTQFYTWLKKGLQEAVIITNGDRFIIVNEVIIK